MSFFYFNGTHLCEPADDAFQDWLAHVPADTALQTGQTLRPGGGHWGGRGRRARSKRADALREEGGSRRKLVGLLVLGLFILLRPSGVGLPLDDSVLLTSRTSEAESDVEALPFRRKFGLEAAAGEAFPELAAAWGPRLADGKNAAWTSKRSPPDRRPSVACRACWYYPKLRASPRCSFAR